MLNEEWKDVIGYEGLYKVSNFGNVYSTRSGRNLIGGKDKDGYRQVLLYPNEGKRETKRVHQLVAKAFIPNPLNYPMINHKDRNVTNNCVNNLEWCDAKYNNNYLDCALRRSIALGKVVAQVDLNGNVVATYHSAAEAHRQTGISRGHICEVCRGERNTAGGYSWRYL